MAFLPVVARDKNHLMQCIFDATIALGNQCSLNFIDVSDIEDMSGLFSTTLKDFNGDISRWKTSKLKYAERMFQYSKFEGDISKWNVQSLADADHMFHNAVGPHGLEKWNPSNLVCAKMMLSGIHRLPHIEKWDLQKCKDHFQFSTLPLQMSTRLAPSVDLEYMFNLRGKAFSKPAWFAALRGQKIGVLHFFSELYFADDPFYKGERIHHNWNNRHRAALEIASSLFQDKTQIAIYAAEMIKRRVTKELTLDFETSDITHHS